MTVLGEMIMQDGIKIGEDSVNRLNTVLIKQNRFDDLKHATEDREYQKKLMRELLPKMDMGNKDGV